jgi:hypothetical protein
MLNSKLNIYASILGDIMCAIASSRTMVLTVDVQRPVVQGRVRMAKEYQQYKAAAELLPAQAETAALISQFSNPFTISTLLRNSHTLFNETKEPADRTDPFTVPEYKRGHQRP